ncbi:MAG: TatD family hydrolase [Phycisphaerales bacterium]
MIDTHCHLTFPEFAGKVPEVLARAAAQGIGGAITISTTTQDCLAALGVAKSHANVWCTAGVHPLYSDDGPHEWENLRLVARDAKCVAWGELGLDNHYKEPGAEVQRRVLSEQLGFIESAREGGPGRMGSATGGIDLPIVIHCREAFADLLPILRRTRLDPSRFVFHCFTGTPDEARGVLDFGAMISFTGVVTYRNAADVQAAAALVPLERMMIETDAPFLSPDPHRGVRPCEPWMASVTARKLAAIKGVAWEEFCRTIDENTRRFFGVSA